MELSMAGSGRERVKPSESSSQLRTEFITPKVEKLTELSFPSVQAKKPCPMPQRPRYERQTRHSSRVLKCPDSLTFWISSQMQQLRK